MLKMTRLASVAAVLLIAAASAVVLPVVHAQTQPSPAATPAAPEPAAPSPIPAPPAPPAGKAADGRVTEAVDNPYGFQALLKGSDIVAKVTLAILAIMSMGSWYIIITKVYEQAKMVKQARAADKTF